MNEKIFSILQPIQEKLDQLLDAQSAIPSGAWAVIGAVIGAAIVAIGTVAGVIYSARAAEKRQRNELMNDRERQRKDEHRAKLEEAIRLLQAIKDWSSEILTLCSQLTFSTVGQAEDKERQLTHLIKFHAEGASKYEMVLTILTIYSATNDSAVRIGSPFREFSEIVVRNARMPSEVNTVDDGPEMDEMRKSLHQACNELVTDVRKEIREKYMP